MRIGDIYENVWSGYKTYLVYTGEKATAHDTRMWIVMNVSGKWRLSKGVFDVQSFRDTEHFPIVGHIDLDDAKDRFVSEVLGRVIDLG